MHKFMAIIIEALVPDVGDFPTLILVRESYVTMFKRAWCLCLPHFHREKQIVFIGKSSFQFFLLVQLLKLQVVLFTMDDDCLYPFHHDKVLDIQPRLRIKRKLWSSKVLNTAKRQEPG